MEISSEDLEEIRINSDKNYLFVIRHGERADGHWGTHNSDSEITSNGKKQAKATAKIVKSIWEKSESHDVKILSSPWLRWLMTSSYIANELGLKNVFFYWAKNLWIPIKDK